MFRVGRGVAFIIVSGRVYVSPSLPLQAGYKRIVFAWHSKPMLAVCHAAPGQCDNRTTQPTTGKEHQWACVGASSFYV